MAERARAPSEKMRLTRWNMRTFTFLPLLPPRPNPLPSPDHFFRGSWHEFPARHTAITRARQTTTIEAGEPEMDFGMRMMAAGGVVTKTHVSETAWVLLHGAAELQFAGRRETVRRGSLFDEAPTALHLGPGTAVTERPLAAGTERAVVRTVNERSNFAPPLYRPTDLKPEYRGTGLLQNAWLRHVCLIFDATTRPEVNLMLGGVANYPGRWSSYPPLPDDHAGDLPPSFHSPRRARPRGVGRGGRESALLRHDGASNWARSRAGDGAGLRHVLFVVHPPLAGPLYTGFTSAAAHSVDARSRTARLAAAGALHFSLTPPSPTP